ncbi:MAG TPA: DUF4349 domain-containing protein [Streptosporangiaceae bacterium]|nr:DUF4349 domain-containing protein [Streptosporangiaceae bacterium]
MAILSSLTDRQRRLLAWTVAILAVLALSIPVGLSVIGRQGSGDASMPAGPTSLDSRSAESPAVGSGAESRDGGAAPDVATPQATAPDAAAAVGATKLVRTAWLGIQVTDLTGSAAKVRAIATTAGGQVLSENVVTTDSPLDVTGGFGDAKIEPVGPSEARLVLGVPSDKLDGVLTELERVGKVSYRSSSSQDVSDTYVDTEARIKTMQAGVDRLRALLTRATSLEQIITLESELTRRQADLDALQARLAELDKRVDQSEVTVTLWTSEAEPVVDDNDFVDSLRGAWEAFLSSIVVIFTGLAVMLPWLVIVLLVVLLARRILRRRGRPTTTD